MTYYPELLATPVPRYTSYPTAAEFDDTIGETEQATGLASVGENEPVSLYVHIPYCKDICYYCGCNTGRANRGQRLANYLDWLGMEIDLVARHLEGRGRIVRVAFGGGSPNAISPAQFATLATRIVDAFAADRAQWSVELDPRGFDTAFADVMSQVGVERASLGVQTFDPAIQEAIGRVQSHRHIARSTALLRSAGVRSLNFDLMYGLPGQDIGIIDETLDAAIALEPDRLAVFGYAHVPHLIARQRRIDAASLPDARARFKQAARVRHYLLGEGYDAVGFDHFAQPGDPLAKAATHGHLRRNFQGYTDDPCDTLIGIGASAISRLGNALVQNEKNAGRYGIRVAHDKLPATRGIATSPLDRVRSRVIEQLLCLGRTNIALLPDRAAIHERLAPFLARDVARLDGYQLTIADTGWPYARSIAASFDPWRAKSQRSFSSAV